ncbi:MAG: iron-containing redox enzyme family protein [Polyangiaceae bacterium]
MTDAFVRSLAQDSATFVTSIERDPLVGRIIRGEAERHEYVRFLVGTYHYVRWSGVLLARTAEGLRRRGRNPSLVALLEAKTEEEAPHDRWALEDLRNLGLNPELVKGEAASAAVVGYVQCNLAWAEAGSAAFLGAAYTLEVLSMRRANVAAKHLREHGRIAGIERSLSFLVGHGEADLGHVRVLERHLAALEDEQERAAVASSAANLRALFPLFFSCPESVAEPRLLRATG